MADAKIICPLKVSIIIPCFNASAWLPSTLDSCLQQKDLIRDIIIIDDFSTDNSWEIIAEYRTRFPSLIIAKKNNRKGGNNARNLGFGLSQGEYIQWLDADDRLLPGKLPAQLPALEDPAGPDIVYSDWQLDTYSTEGEVVSSEYKRHAQYEDFTYQLLIDNWSPPHNYLLKRSFAEKLQVIKAWNPDTPVYQDREYFTLAAIHGGRFQYIPGNFCVYNRWSKESVSQRTEQKLRFLLVLLDEFREQIRLQQRLEVSRKACYDKVILTLSLLASISADGLTIRRKYRFGDIYWPMLREYRTRIKVLLALTLNRFFIIPK
jgi:glycosyltransferase involved in cell wall biosynthesis